jgi:hypothetical protein
LDRGKSAALLVWAFVFELDMTWFFMFISRVILLDLNV